MNYHIIITIQNQLIIFTRRKYSHCKNKKSVILYLQTKIFHLADSVVCRNHRKNVLHVSWMHLLQCFPTFKIAFCGVTNTVQGHCM